MGKLKFLRNITPLLLSHHPNCSKFENHVFHVGKIKICAGCSVVYPTILVSMIVIYITRLYALMPFEFLLFTGILFSIPRIANIPKNNGRKAFKIINTCDSCIYHRKWSACPGFKELYRNIRVEQNK